MATMGLSYIVSEIDGDFSRKSQIFPTSVYFAPQSKGFPLKLSIGACGQTTRIMGLPGQERCLTISSAVWIQSTNVMDRRTPDDSKVIIIVIEMSIIKVALSHFCCRTTVQSDSDRAITHSVAP